jgi:hypothetical protein
MNSSRRSPGPGRVAGPEGVVPSPAAVTAEEVNHMTPTTLTDAVSPMEANIDRLYWSAMGSSRMMPGLGLAASRYGWRQNRSKNERPESAERERPVSKIRVPRAGGS